MDTMKYSVYALRHKPTGHVYIGSTASIPQRTKQWRLAIVNQRVPASFKPLSRSFTDWEVVELCPAETMRKARYLESYCILQAARRDAGKLLNEQRWAIPPETVVPRSTYYARRKRGLTLEDAVSLKDGRGRTAKTAIVDHDGRHLTQSEAAKRLMCREKTLARRLRDWRKQHTVQSSVALSYLEQMSLQFGDFKKRIEKLST